MTRESRQLLWAFTGVLLLALLVLATLRAQTRTTITATVPPEQVSWLARCDTLRVDAAKDVTVSSVRVSTDGVRALLDVDKLASWLQCRTIGKASYACQGPAKARDEMAKTCTVSEWKDATKLDERTRDTMRLTCCGEATVGGETRTMWPCGWPRAQVVRIDGYGPGVVGSESPCGHVKQPDIKPEEPVKEIIR